MIGIGNAYLELFWRKAARCCESIGLWFTLTWLCWTWSVPCKCGVFCQDTKLSTPGIVPALCPLIVASTSTQRTLSRMLGPSQTSCLSAEVRNPLWTCCKIRLRWPFWLIADRAPAGCRVSAPVRCCSGPQDSCEVIGLPCTGAQEQRLANLVPYPATSAYTLTAIGSLEAASQRGSILVSLSPGNGLARTWGE